MAAALSAGFCVGAGAQLPSNPTGTGFSAAQAGNTLTVTTSTNRTSIGWDTFSIGAGNRVDFVQPSSASWVMNRVLSNTPSDLLGTLSSNGGVMLYNPAGIFVRPGAMIDVARFIASTLPMSDSDFLGGRMRFTALPGAGTIKNEGTIRTASGGSVYLVAPNVENHGVITAPNGEILLAAGKSVELVDTGTPGVKIELTADSEQALNVGQLLAGSGRIGLAGALVKNGGEINATGVVNDGGRIFLKATNKVEVDAAGRILANGASGGTIEIDSGNTTLVAGTVEAKGGAGKGGRIELLGDKVGVYESALVDASGSNGGGTILVGGDYQGTNPLVRNASAVYFGPQATLKADASDSGDGGKVIVWANETARAYGRISATGGPNGGSGGFVETSSKQYLDVGGIQVDRSAPNGQAGTWLLDPENVTIDTGASNFLNGGSFSSNSPGLVFDGAYGASIINWSTITSNLASGPVIITTSPSSAGYGGTITFTTGQTFSYNSTNALWFVANQNITGTNFLLTNSGSGDLYMIAGFGGTSLPGTPWDINSYGVTAGTGTINLINSRADTLGSVFVKAGSDVNVVVSGAYGGTAHLKSGGNMKVDTWGDFNVEVKPTSGTGTAQVIAGGSQTINLHGSTSDLRISAAAGTGFGGMALLKAGGAQTIDFKSGGSHSLNVTGGYGGNVAYGAFATIEAGGNQQILNSGGGTLAISLTGGDAGNGTFGDHTAFYGGPLICSNCDSLRFAEIEANGSQLIQATTLTLTGGSGGNGNNASIEANGTQTINVTGAIVLQGGSGGGVFTPGFGVEGLLGNSAELGSDTSQTITAASVTMNAGGASTDYSGAIIHAPVQSITTAGAFAMNGGGGIGATSGLAFPIATGALLGFESGANITLNVGGALSISGGGGSSGPAMIGALSGAANIDITAGSITGAAGAGGAYIGSMTPVGTVTMVSTAGLTSMPVGTTIQADSLDAASYGGVLSLLGGNNVTFVNLTATGANSISYASKAAMAHIQSATSGSGNIAINATAMSSSSLGLGLLSTSGNVSVSAGAAIVDDNASGVVNVQGNSVVLSSIYGGSAGLLAISADVEAATSLSASVASSATNGGIRISETASSAAARTLTDASSSSVGIHFDTVGSIGSTFGAGSLGVALTNTAAPVDISANNDISTNSISLAGNVTDVAITAGNMLKINGPVSSSLGSVYLSGLAQVDITSNVSASSDIGILSGGNLNFSSGTISAGGAIAAVGDIVTISGSAQINGAPSGTAIIGSSAITVDGASIDVDGEIGLLSGGDITVTNGGVVSNSGVIGSIFVSGAGKLAVSYGGAIMAGDDVFIEMTGGASEIRLDQGGKIVADMATGVPATIYIDFTTRPTGGLFIDGAETTTPSATGSGLYVVTPTTPATEGAGLEILHMGASSTTSTNAVTSQLGSITESVTTSTTNVSNTTTVEVLATATELSSAENQDETSAQQDTTLQPKEGTKDDGKQKPAQCT